MPPKASVRVVRSGGQSVGYLQFWYVHVQGVPDLITRALEGRLKNVDALVLDLRGRGGSATEVTRIVQVVEGYQKRTGRPVVALADRQSRSGKDVLIYEFKQRGVRIVGEASAGAVIPASFGDVGHDSVLMFPTTRLPTYTDLLELKPVPPDVSSNGAACSPRDGTRISRGRDRGGAAVWRPPGGGRATSRRRPKRSAKRYKDLILLLPGMATRTFAGGTSH